MDEIVLSLSLVVEKKIIHHILLYILNEVTCILQAYNKNSKVNK